jgi:hypothetical protein
MVAKIQGFWFVTSMYLTPPSRLWRLKASTCAQVRGFAEVVARVLPRRGGSCRLGSRTSWDFEMICGL